MIVKKNMTRIALVDDEANILTSVSLALKTEGFEVDVLKGASNILKHIKYIYFEHHFDSMIMKNYKFSEINAFLKINNFTKIKKFKMPLRKTFEYIYENNTK